jgi:L-threonine kinase
MSQRRVEFTPITLAVPGTCGELIQGWYIPWRRPILVSCPIARYSWVTVQLRPSPEIDAPPGCFKSRQAARLLLDTLGRPDLGATIHINSQLLPGRGMASSTTDIIGVMAGLALALNQPLSPEALAGLACQIEPSDSIMFAGLAMLAYRDEGLARRLGPIPPLPLLMLDPGQAIDTLTYNAQLDLSAVRNLAATTQAALDVLGQGLAAGDAALIGQAASLSAASYQAIHYNPLVEAAQSWAGSTGAVGVARAHSGSVVGLLYPPDQDLAGPARWVAGRFEGCLTATRLTNAGFRRVKLMPFDKPLSLC